MAKTRHLEHILRGREAWNAWRQTEPKLEPDLSGADLGGANLSLANLSRTDLADAQLLGANLAGANLGGANFTRANLKGANLSAVTTAVAAAEFSGANLSEADLSAANLYGAKLGRANLSRATLSGARLGAAQLSEATLIAADISAADLSGANLVKANVGEASLMGANLSGANLTRANLTLANLTWADLSEVQLIGSRLDRATLTGANLSRANLRGANLAEANLSRANLSGAMLGRAHLNRANLTAAVLVETDLTNTDLTGCSIYGMSAWHLRLSEGTRQRNLVVTPEDEPEVTADGLEVAQFLYMMLHNKQVLSIVNSITSKIVLILGSFPPERRAVLDVLRDGLRQPALGYVPVVYNFQDGGHPESVETVTTLARMACFAIADLSDAKGLQHDLQLIAASSPKLPVQPLILAAQQQPGVSDVIERFPTVLKTYRYEHVTQLADDFDTLVLACGLKSWSLQRHSHEPVRSGIRQSDEVRSRTT